jgi:hypothetical protein
MLIHKLRLTIAAQEDAEVVEPSDYALKLNTIDQEYRDWNLGFPDVVKEGILQILFIGGHCFLAFCFRSNRLSLSLPDP